MSEPAREYKLETKKKTVLYKDIPVLSVNLRYPVFKALSDEPKEKAFTAKINRFYCDSAEKYVKMLGKNYAKRAAKIYNSNGGIKASFLMNCTVTYSDANYISAFADISVYNGKDTKVSRFSQLWSKEKSAILPAGMVFDTSYKSKKYVKEIICSIAEKNLRRKDFSYFDNYKSIINKSFDFSKFYIVPNGVAFYFDKSTLSAACPDVCVFVIPFERIDGIVKLGFSDNFSEKSKNHTADIKKHISSAKRS